PLSCLSAVAIRALCPLLFSSFALPPPPFSTLFPYTTLFRSNFRFCSNRLFHCFFQHLKRFYLIFYRMGIRRNHDFFYIICFCEFLKPAGNVFAGADEH